MPGDAVVEDKAAGKAAGGIAPQPLPAPPHPTLDVAKVVFERADGRLQLPPQLLEAPLPLPQEILDTLALRRRGARLGISHAQ